MPDTHSLATLLEFLKSKVTGSCYKDHPIEEVKSHLGRWYPRRSEYEQYIHWDEANPKKYTRNVIFSNEHMDVLLMCWPPRCASSLHCHDRSSCWVALVDGVVHEIQYDIPPLDRKFVEDEMFHPTGAKGRCGQLKARTVTQLGGQGGLFATYINNTIGIHVIENRSDEPAYTMHVYAPGLRQMKLFDAVTGEVSVAVAAATEPTETHRGMQWTSCDGRPICTSFDVDLWNRLQQGHSSSCCDESNDNDSTVLV